jgi:uncharacterized protein (DUF4415 family)
MASPREFPFHKARRVTKEEAEKARQAIEGVTGEHRRPRGRPPKADHERYQPVSLRLDPRALAWAKRAAKKKGVGYQTVINEALLAKAGRK